MVLDGVNYRIHLVQRAAQGNNVIQQTRGPVWSDIDRIAQELRAIHPEWGKGQVAAHILKTRQPTHAQDKVYSLKHIVRRISHLWPKPRQNPIYKNGE